MSKSSVAGGVSISSKLNKDNAEADSLSLASETLVVTAGAVSINVETCANELYLTMPEVATVITTSGTPRQGKGIILHITHGLAVQTLTWDATELVSGDVLVGAAGETEDVLVEYVDSTTSYRFFSSGLADQVIVDA